VRLKACLSFQLFSRSRTVCALKHACHFNYFLGPVLFAPESMPVISTIF
jgi:hypothetical protein